MSWVSVLPVIGNIVGKVAEKIWPDRQAERMKALEIELEEVRQSGGRITPKQALKYVGVLAFAACLILLVVQFFRPQFSLPEGWEEVLSFCVSLFGL